jgi:hypothetical protein
LYQNQQVKFVKWDVATCTAQDFTVEYEIDRAAFKWWFSQLHLQLEDEFKPITQFK